MIRKTADYLYQRPGSQNWWLRLQYPAAMNRPKVQKSLGTPDRHEAEIKALPLIQQHRLDLYERRHQTQPGFGMRWNRMGYHFALGETVAEDGARVITTENSRITIRDGRIVSEEANFFTISATHRFDPTEPNPSGLPQVSGAVKVQPKVKQNPVDNDSAILDVYLGLRTRNPYFDKEARDTWALFKRLVADKPIRECTRDDARLLVAHLQTKAKPDKRATIVKKLNYLAAPVNFAIKEGKLMFNPFLAVAPQDDDADHRVPFTDADMATVAAALPDMEPEVARLWVLLATTGMRLGEAFHVNGEDTEKGIRRIKIGSKTEQSERWIPIPDAAMPFLPAKIDGPLFESNAKNLGRVLHRVIDKLGVKGEGKVLHSLRHRAKDQLRAEECPLNIQYELMGHEIKTVAAGYGHGSPMRVLKPWIDKIGL